LMDHNVLPKTVNHVNLTKKTNVLSVKPIKTEFWITEDVYAESDIKKSKTQFVLELTKFQNQNQLKNQIANLLLPTLEISNHPTLTCKPEVDMPEELSKIN